MGVELRTKDAALAMGLFIAGYDDDKQRRGVMLNLPHPIRQWFYSAYFRLVDVYSIRSRSGERMQILIGYHGNGHDLWIRNPATGTCRRF
jgi:hypothetical protein